MPSVFLGYVAGSGFTPLVSGNPWSGQLEPVGQVYVKADYRNSGYVYVSLSGAWAFSGQMSTLVGSGGPTINSGGMPLSGLGLMDGMILAPGDVYPVPRMAMANTGPYSGRYPICVGCDAAASGFARVYFEMM